MQKEIIEKINKNIPVIIETDTIYGISMKVSEENRIKINKIKESNEDKELICLFSNFKQIKKIININLKTKKIFKKNKCTTFIFDIDDQKKVALRYVKGYIGKIINKTGIIYSTSANKSGSKYSEEIPVFEKLVGKENVYYRKKIGNAPSAIIDFNTLNKIR